MATSTLSIPNNLDVQGNLTVRGTLPSYPRASLAQDDFAAFPIPLTDLRIFDAFGTLLSSAANDDLGIAAGTFGTGAPYVTAGDCKAASVTRRARTVVQLPLNYVAGQSLRITATAGMLTTVSDTSAVVDVEAWKLAGDTLVSGSDMVATAATSINSLTFADTDFDLTTTTLSAGDFIDVRISITVVDSATGTAVTPAIASLALKADVKG